MLKVSVVIPTFNRINQTKKTIQLLLNSNGINEVFALEIVVADSSPTDELKTALENEFHSSIVYTRPEKEGIAANKNQGATVASHSILIFCDSDMEVETDTIIKTLESLQNNPTAAAVGGNVIWKGGPADQSYDRPRPEDRRVTIDGTTYIEAIYSRYIATYKKVFELVEGYDETVFNMRGEGSDMSIRYWRAGFPLTFDSTINVYHVHEVEGGIIRNVPHPEYGIAKDVLLLGYKYDMLEDTYKNFEVSIGSNFKQFGELGYARVVEGIGKYYDFITKMKPILDEQKKNMKPVFNFKFLEVFTDRNLFHKCIQEAKPKLELIRKEAFKP